MLLPRLPSLDVEHVLPSLLPYDAPKIFFLHPLSVQVRIAIFLRFLLFAPCQKVSVVSHFWRAAIYDPLPTAIPWLLPSSPWNCRPSALYATKCRSGDDCRAKPQMNLDEKGASFFIMVLLPLSIKRMYIREDTPDRPRSQPRVAFSASVRPLVIDVVARASGTFQRASGWRWFLFHDMVKY